MSSDLPATIHAKFEAAFNAFDLDALVALYEPGALLLSPPNVPVSGLDAIRETYRGFFALKPVIRVETLSVFETKEGIALLHGRWNLTATQPDGTEVRQEGRNTEVVRRESDGQWRFLIDNPHTP